MPTHETAFMLFASYRLTIQTSVNHAGMEDVMNI